jgi:hypothetical protein
MRIIAVLMLSLLAIFSLAAGPPAFAQAPSGPDAASIQETIRNQLEAFKVDDGAAAYSYAAPNVKAIFPTVEAFMAMVKRGYQPVYRPRSYSFRNLEEASGTIMQTVEILGPDGDYWTAVYTMARQEDGSWKITGCRIVKTEGGSA